MALPAVLVRALELSEGVAHEAGRGQRVGGEACEGRERRRHGARNVKRGAEHEGGEATGAGAPPGERWRRGGKGRGDTGARGQASRS